MGENFQVFIRCIVSTQSIINSIAILTIVDL